MDTSTATPESLIARLLARAVQSARDAGETPLGAERTRRLRRALDILDELRRSLDFGRGGEIAFNLERLYEFASDRLLQAGVTASSKPVEEALVALVPISEAWQELAAGAHGESAA